MSTFSYENMEIGDGSEACIEYERVTFDPDILDEEKTRIRQALEEYCKLDTFAEILIAEKLIKILKEN